MSGTLDRAVILAAGRGSRITAAAPGVPKPWLPLAPAGPTFLGWHVACLQALGVGEIVLVGNTETIARGLPEGADGRVRWLLNPEAEVGSAHSANVAWEAGALDGRVLLMDADLLYDPVLLDVLVAAPGARSKILVHAEHRDSGEEVLVYGPTAAPRLQGKGLAGTPMVAGLACLGEATGMLLWEPGDHRDLRAASAWALGFSSAKKRSEHEDVTNLLMAQGRLEAVLVPSGAAFLEVDTPADYALATSMYRSL